MSNNFKRYLKSFVLLCIFLSVVSFQGDPTFAREFQDSVCERAKGLNQTDQAIADCPELALLDYPAEILFPTSAGGPDAYGYTWNDSVTMDWKEIISSGGGVQIFPLPNKPDTRVDDMVVGPFPLGFNFKFYENEYSQIYISSNGLIGFSEDFAGILAGASNLTIPFDYRIPQNFVAPFWDDLIIGGEFNIGKVAYGAGVDARGSYFVVEWSQVTKTNLQGSLTFEAILYASGDILFQYQTLNGDLESASVGIEDADGVDGLAYLVNAPGLSSNQAILFSRPSPAARVKLISSSPGAFNINRQSVHQILVRNTGSLGADVYDLMTSSNPPGWQILLLDSQGVELQDTDGDSIPDTGSLGQNETKEITVKIMAPAWAAPNSSVKVTLEARSSLSIFTSQWVELRSALPSQFALTYRRGLNVYLDLISYAVQYTAHEFKYYAGGTFAMAHASQNNFVGVSLVSGGSLYTNLEYMMVNSIGSTIFEAPRLLTENSGAEDVRDNAPVVVTAPNGNIGIAWVRRLTQVNANPRTNINIFFKILDPSGKTVILPETNVTQNLTWANTEDPVLKGFENLCIEAIEDTVSGEGRFHLAWIEKHTRNTGLITTDVAHIVYSDTGASIKTATIFNPINHSDKIDYFEPALVSYNNNQILLFYFVSDTNEPDDPIDSLVYARLDAGGYALQAQTYLYDVDGEKIDATQMSDGKVGLVWTNSVNEHVNAVILGSNLSKPADYIELTNPDGRPSRAVSIVNGLADQVILTWMDGGLLERMYYAVLNSNGEVVVAPIPFKYREGAPALETVAGLGNAEYLAQWIRYLPVVSR
jgi:hypothetical protein